MQREGELVSWNDSWIVYCLGGCRPTIMVYLSLNYSVDSENMSSYFYLLMLKDFSSLPSSSLPSLPLHLLSLLFSSLPFPVKSFYLILNYYFYINKNQFLIAESVLSVYSYHHPHITDIPKALTVNPIFPFLSTSWIPVSSPVSSF